MYHYTSGLIPAQFPAISHPPICAAEDEQPVCNLPKKIVLYHKKF